MLHEGRAVRIKGQVAQADIFTTCKFSRDTHTTFTIFTYLSYFKTIRLTMLLLFICSCLFHTCKDFWKYH